MQLTLGPYTKAIIALVGGVLAAIGQAIGTGGLGDLRGEE